MKTYFRSFAAAALLIAATSLPGYAEDAAPAATTPSPAASAPAETTPTQAQPPKAADATPDATSEPTAHHRRHYAHRHHWRYAYWEPFPVFWPHVYHSRIVWNRVPWFRF